MRTFTTDGPANEAFHYVLPAATRLAEARGLVDQGAYFVLRAPGRSGKTTALRALAAEITSEGRFAALVCSSAVAGPARSDLGLVQDALLSALRIAAERDLPPSMHPPALPDSAEGTRLWEVISAWARVCPRPLVLFLDDLDTLHDAALESILRQLETGFSGRPDHFAWSVGLVSQFDLRPRPGSSTETTVPRFSTGPFERFWSSRLLAPFTLDEMRAFYATPFGGDGRGFTPEALAFAHEASAGHPFFVQAIGREILEMNSSESTITVAHVVSAYRRLVERGVTPIDDLPARLEDRRVRHVVEPLLQGSASIASADEDDLAFVRDVGLVAFDNPVRIDSALHRALLPRLLSLKVQRAVVDDPAFCFDADGRLSMQRLLQSFAAFYEAYASELLAAQTYTKIGPELVFLGYLFRMLAGRGWVDVEFGTSRGRMDVTVSIAISPEHSNENGNTSQINPSDVLVLVARRKGDTGVKKRGLAWLESAMTRMSADAGTLVVFDKRDKRAPGKRVKCKETTTAQGKTVRSLRV